MKKIIIIGLSALLSACATEHYVTDVTSQSHREEFKIADVTQPLSSNQDELQGVSEQDAAPKVSQAPSKAKAPQKPKRAMTSIVPPSTKQQQAQTRFGYTIQVVAVGAQRKVDRFVKELPKQGQPIWENYKEVNGTKWFSVLYGDFATRGQAKKAVDSLPQEILKLKPFVKSIDSIKNSKFPTMNKLN
ncbi:SPOR domain-containing protein [Vibrio zhugei]|uniref:SPOR domain-containing protein n=1 Tax=Vibrio zhugei TaxID=2479546 RepID=A0ABV7CAH7_9VIBR|nr:SPOR domain-containing protein [Vibrio zhugei]